MVYVTKSAQETHSLGKELGHKLLKNGKSQILSLFGDLGSGKTAFVQGLAQGLGIVRSVLSPTFVFEREYHLKNGKNFYHIDLYRIEKASQAYGLGIEDLFDQDSVIVAIEWADRIKEILPKERIDIFFEYLGENERRITVKSH